MTLSFLAQTSENFTKNLIPTATKHTRKKEYLLPDAKLCC